MQALAHNILQKPFRTCFKWAGLGFCGVLLAYQFFLMGSVLWYAFVNPSSSAFMRAQALQLQDTKIVHQWVDYDQMSKAIKKAVIASEDSGFTQHSGVEWDAIWQAIHYNQHHQTKMRGGSTITQQLAKNLFLSSDRSYLRKAQELIITYMLEMMMSKKRILELYLNMAQFGEHIFGVEAASQFYFKKSSKNLSNAEAARLAVLLPNPRYYGKYWRGPYLTRRTNIIKARMNQVLVPTP